MRTVVRSLPQLIDDITVDVHGGDGRVSGFLQVFHDEVATPISTTVLGMTVEGHRLPLGGRRAARPGRYLPTPGDHWDGRGRRCTRRTGLDRRLPARRLSNLALPPPLPVRMTWRRHHADAACYLGIAIDDGVIGTFEVHLLWDGVVESSGSFVIGGLDVDRQAGEPHVAAAVVEMEMGVDDESNVVDAVAVRFERGFDRVVNDLVVVVEVLVAAADPRLVQDESRLVAKHEREDFARLPAQRVRIWKRHVREMKRYNILERELRHLQSVRRETASEGGFQLGPLRHPSPVLPPTGRSRLRRREPRADTQ